MAVEIVNDFFQYPGFYTGISGGAPGRGRLIKPDAK